MTETAAVINNDVKVVLLGDSGAGKTAILHRFFENSFDDDNSATIGIDFRHKTYILDDNTSVRLQIWDTAGQERFRHLAPSYIREAAVAVIVFDSTDTRSSESIQRWVQYVQTWKSRQIHIVLVASKCDRSSKRFIPPEGIELMKYGGVYIETSAKTGDNVNTVFNTVAHLPFLEHKRSQSEPIKLNEEASSESGYCCI